MAQKIDTNTMDEGLYATMLHRKKPKKWPKCNHVATPHGSFGSLSLWGRHAIFGGITQNVHKTDKKCKWNVEKVLVNLLILREMLKMRILSIKKNKKNIYLYISYIYMYIRTFFLTFLSCLLIGIRFVYLL